jgi:hypothetical protein
MQWLHITVQGVDTSRPETADAVLAVLAVQDAVLYVSRGADIVCNIINRFSHDIRLRVAVHACCCAGHGHQQA